MKPLHALALACFLPFSILLVVGIAAATTVPREGSGEVAQGAPSAPATLASPAASATDGDLHAHMEALQSGMKEMRKMLGKDDQKDALIALAANLQGSALACFTLLPKPEAPIEDAVKASEWRIGYVRRMVEVYDTLLQLELAATKGDHEAVKAHYKALGEQKTTGHEAYQAD